MFKKSFLIEMDLNTPSVPNLEQITKAIMLYAEKTGENIIFENIEENTNVTFYLNNTLYRIKIILLKGCTHLKCIEV